MSGMKGGRVSVTVATALHSRHGVRVLSVPSGRCQGGTESRTVGDCVRLYARLRAVLEDVLSTYARGTRLCMVYDCVQRTFVFLRQVNECVLNTFIYCKGRFAPTLPLIPP